MFCNTTLDLICKLQDLSDTKEQKDLAKDIEFWFNGVFGGLIAIVGLNDRAKGKHRPGGKRISEACND